MPKADKKTENSKPVSHNWFSFMNKKRFCNIYKMTTTLYYFSQLMFFDKDIIYGFCLPASVQSAPKKK
jgi:hypothetical protein